MTAKRRRFYPPDTWPRILVSLLVYGSLVGGLGRTVGLISRRYEQADSVAAVLGWWLLLVVALLGTVLGAAFALGAIHHAIERLQRRDR